MGSLAFRSWPLHSGGRRTTHSSTSPLHPGSASDLEVTPRRADRHAQDARQLHFQRRLYLI
jgi:hypothetical protein